MTKLSFSGLKYGQSDAQSFQQYDLKFEYLDCSFLESIQTIPSSNIAHTSFHRLEYCVVKKLEK